MPQVQGHDQDRFEKLLEDDLEDAYENAPVGYVTTMPDGRIVRVNETFVAWTGLAREQLKHKKFQTLFNIPGRIYYETHLGPLLAMQGSLNEIAIDLVRHDGKPLPVLINAAAKRNAAGDPLLLRFTAFNATDRRRYEQQLLEARRRAEAAVQEKTELLAMLSHDIRTPLSAFLVMSRLLARSAVSPKQQETVRKLRASATTVLDLVTGILEQSRLEAGALVLNLQPADLRQRVCELVESLEPLATDKSLALECVIDERLPPAVLVDATKFGQIVGNLVGNALKFTDRGSIRAELVVLDLDATKARLRTRVIDTGIGIAEDMIPKIFERFGQTKEGASRGGMGLGLAIIRKLLEAQRSELHLSSRVGEGTEFWFDLVLDRPTDEASAAATAPDSPKPEPR